MNETFKMVVGREVWRVRVRPIGNTTIAGRRCSFYEPLNSNLPAGILSHDFWQHLLRSAE